MRLIQTLRKRDADRYVVPRSIQQWMPIQYVYPDGIFREGKRFSKSFRFTDINYSIVSKDDRTALFMLYCELINSSDVGAQIKLSLYNRRPDRANVESSVLIPSSDDGLDHLRDELNDHIMDMALTANNNIIQDKIYTISVVKKNIEEARAYFNRVSAELQTRFAQLSSTLTALDASERLRIFHDVFRDGDTSSFKFDLRTQNKRGQSPVDYICPEAIEVKSSYIHIEGSNPNDEQWGRVLYLRDYATYIKDTLIQELCELNSTMMLSIDMLPIPTDEAVKQTKNQVDKVNTNIERFNQRRAANNASATLPYDMSMQSKEANDFLDDLITRDQRMLLCSVTIFHMAKTKEQLDNDTETLMAVGRKHLCQLAVLKYQQSDGLNTVLPYGVRKIDALRTMTTESTACLMPFRSQELFNNGGICYGRNAISKNLLVIDRKSLLNGNGFIFGVSGSGKSFIAKFETICKALSSNDEIIVIDPEAEYSPVIRALGGEVISISATSRNHINAMDISSEYGDIDDPIILKSEFIMSLCDMAVGKGGLAAKDKSIIDRCLNKVYRQYTTNGYQGLPPTLEDFYQELLRQPEREAHEIALNIELFIKGSLSTFARQTNVDTKNRIVCYDIHDLGKQLKPIGMLVVLDAIYNRIARNKELKRNTWVYIDEVYLLFQNEYSANFLFELWKRVRKCGAFATGISQNLEDMLQSHVARTMLGNSEFLILLNQSASDRSSLAKLLNISDTQLTYITNAGVGKGLIRCSENIVPFENSFPTDTQLYKLMTTKLEESL